MKTKKLLLVLSSLSAVAVATSLTIGANNTNVSADSAMPTSTDMDKKVDTYDNLTSETIYASPDVEIEFDFDKEANAELQDPSKHTGSKDDPMDIYTAFHNVGAGDTVVLLDGTYKMDNRLTVPQSGNAKRMIYAVAEHTGSVHLDFSGESRDAAVMSNNRGIQLVGSYWHMTGLDVYGAADNGIYVAGSFNTIERCTMHENEDTGLQLGRAASTQTSVADWPHNNLILNCTSYNNYDVQSLGENADGFAAKLTVGEGNVFDGCIAYRNSDDGWDMYAKTDSGNIGTITLLNCVAFENGWVLNKTTSYTKDTEGNYLDSFACQNGDGNGFKLGGSTMEGDMVLKNCMSFNNRMGGFADNSNPGVLSLYNCTSYNNSVYMSMTAASTGAIDETGDTGHFGANDGGSENFAMARTEGSYNTFYSCLSYVSNRDASTSYENYDEYRGAASYCIFNTGMNKYTQITTPIDSSSYDSTKKGPAYDGTISDSTFKAVSLGVEMNGNTTIDTTLRNEDGSINMGDMLALNDEALLTFADGSAIGCTLNKSSMDEYEHTNWTDFEGVSTSKNYVTAYKALEVLTLPCNCNYVYQDIDLVTKMNGVTISWYSSDESILKIGYYETTAVSSRNYLTGNVIRSRTEDKTITLVATASVGTISLSKTFTLTIKQETASIGTVSGIDSKYILSQYATWYDPEIVVTDAASYSNNPLTEGTDYTISLSYMYAENAAAKQYEIDGVYTTVPGVYTVSYTITSLLGDNKTIEGSYVVYVLSEDTEINLSQSSTLASTYGITKTDGYDYMVNASRDGAMVTAAFTGTYGYMYIATSTESTMSVEGVIANGTQIAIVDEYATGVAPNDNTAAYNVFVVITDRSLKHKSEVYTSHVSVVSISTADEFYKLATGATTIDAATIYLLANDIDFTGITKDFENNTGSFTGLLNGQGHIISNITITATGKVKGANIFYRLKNGTIMNVTFENITITSTNTSDSVSGIVGQMNGGYIHNVCLRNVAVNSIGASVGGLVGQVTGGVNYITNVSLVNPLEKGWISGSKYFGGLVGNVQKATDESLVELYMTDCFVNAYIGDHDDQGYVGGIVGRNKNEFECYVMSIVRCYFTGVVDTFYTYSGGIVGSVDSSSGHVKIASCVSDCQLVIKDSTLDKNNTEIGQKNNSPIVGRFTYVVDYTICYSNYGPYTEYHTEVNSDKDDFFTKIATSSFWSNLGYTTERGWTFTEGTAPYCVLSNSLVA